MPMNAPRRVETGVEHISGIDFICLTPEQWKKYSVTCIDRSIKDEKDGKEIKGSLYDHRLGATRNASCDTCNENDVVCPGHFAHIALPAPVYNPLYVESLVYILRCICHKCGKLRTSPLPLLPNMGPTLLWERLVAMSKAGDKVTICKRCGETQHKYKEVGGKQSVPKIDVLVPGKGKPKYKKYQETEVYDVLSNIPRSTMKHLGFTPDLDLRGCLLYNMPVPPTSIRPSVHVGDELKPDDLSEMYSQIITLTSRLNNPNSGRKNRKKRSEKELMLEICLRASTVIDNTNGLNTKMVSNNKKRVLKGLYDRTQKKEGHIINNVVAKRSVLSARVPIVGAPDYEIYEIGIPQYIASTLTKCVDVCTFNINTLTTMIKRGDVVSIQRGTDIYRIFTRVLPLRCGDVCHVRMQDGDSVWANRMPTLRVESIMVFKARIHKDPSINAAYLPLEVCKAYNADKQSMSATGGRGGSRETVQPPSHSE